jgi:hypothetical protein
MDVNEPTLLRTEETPELSGLIALLCSYTSRTVPRLPHSLAKCVVAGHEYRRRFHSGESTIADDKDPLCHQYSHRTRPSAVPVRCQPMQSRVHDVLLSFINNLKVSYSGTLGTRFVTTGSPVSIDMSSQRGPTVYNGETQVQDCVGLRIERLGQLLSLNISDPHM